MRAHRTLFFVRLKTKEIAFNESYSPVATEKGFWTAMKYGRERVPFQGAYGDVLDGKIAAYFRSKGKVAPVLVFVNISDTSPFAGHGSRPGDIWLTINTDGVKVYRTSKKDTWPVWAINASLPPNERYKLSNLMLLGIYFGEDKPSLSQYLEPILSNINKAKSPFPVRFKLDDNSEFVEMCRIQVISFPLDMDARVRISLLLF